MLLVLVYLFFSIVEMSEEDLINEMNNIYEIRIVEIGFGLGLISVLVLVCFWSCSRSLYWSLSVFYFVNISIEKFNVMVVVPLMGDYSSLKLGCPISLILYDSTLSLAYKYLP